MAGVCKTSKATHSLTVKSMLFGKIVCALHYSCSPLLMISSVCMLGTCWHGRPLRLALILVVVFVLFTYLTCESPLSRLETTVVVIVILVEWSRSRVSEKNPVYQWNCICERRGQVRRGCGRRRRRKRVERKKDGGAKEDEKSEKKIKEWRFGQRLKAKVLSGCRSRNSSNIERSTHNRSKCAQQDCCGRAFLNRIWQIGTRKRTSGQCGHTHARLASKTWSTK